jgi:osmoprotectant transport system substrate-binding protein
MIGLISLVALVATACGSSSGSKATTTKGLALGGPSECPVRPYCEPGLKSKYGMQIKSFKALDPGGPLTVKAIKDGTVDFGLMFTSDPTVEAQGLQLLTDDQKLQASDNIVPVLAKKFDKPPATSALNAVDAKLSQEALVGMNKAVQIQHATPQAVAAGFLAAVGLNTKAALCGGASGSGKITIGAFNFAESKLLGEVYSAALKICGYSTSVKALGSREVVYPALTRGDLNLVAEYAATLTDFINTKKNGTAAPIKSSGDITATMAALRSELPTSLVALDPAAATDQNGFAVTKAFATAHSLTTMSDLAAYSKTV